MTHKVVQNMPRVCMRAEVLPPGATLPCGRRERIQRRPVVRGAKCTSTEHNRACSMPASSNLGQHLISRRVWNRFFSYRWFIKQRSYFLNNFLHSYLVTNVVLWFHFSVLIQARYSFLLSFAIFQKLLFTFLSLYTFTVFFFSPFA